MVYPYRGVDQYHAGSLRLRGIGCRSGIVPPIRANRLAASLSTSAFNAAFTTAEFDSKEVKRFALSSNSSSRFTVVLMAPPTLKLLPVFQFIHTIIHQLMRYYDALLSQSSSTIRATRRPIRTE